MPSHDAYDIVRLGHPVLRTTAQPVDPEVLRGAPVQALIDALLATMRATGSVGLAAPQVGQAHQIFVYATVDPDAAAADAADPDAADPTRAADTEVRVLVNPAIEPEPGEPVWDWEGCASISDLRGLVPRPQAVRVHALDRHGERLEYRAEGYEARILQHEFDHLNGIVFLDRMRDLRSLAFAAEWERFMTEGGEDQPAVG